jgi:hypothetical protein
MSPHRNIFLACILVSLVSFLNTRNFCYYDYDMLYHNNFSLSYQKWYFDGTEKIFPYLTAIIDVQNGVVAGITWDDSCIFCTSNECEPNTFDFAGVLATEAEAKQPVGGCYISREECTDLLSEGKTDCDLLLYVVWTGTDSNGNDFQSSSNRFSAFPPQSWSGRISQNLPAFVPQSTEDLPDLTPNN